MPLDEAIDGDAKEADVFPVLEFFGAAFDERCDGFEFLAEGGEACLLYGGEAALGNDEGALPVLSAIDHDEECAGAEASEDFVGVVGLAGNAHPEDVDGRAEVVDWEVGFLAGDGVAAVGADGEGGADGFGTLRGFGDDADHAIVSLEQVDGFVLHEEIEFWKSFGFFGEEIEEVPLGHDGDEFAVGGEVGEVGDRGGKIVDVDAEVVDFLVRALEEVMKEAEFVHELEGGGVDGVAAEVAEEVGVFFEDDDVDAGAGKEEAEHHAGGTTADDAAGGSVVRR